MAKYNTGNPLGSRSPKDLSDNAENLDDAVNTPLETWTDRFGKQRLSLAGMSKAAGDASIAIGAAQESVAARDASASNAADARMSAVRADHARAGAEAAKGAAQDAADAALSSNRTVFRETWGQLLVAMSAPQASRSEHLGEW
ncbi:hypothetical protein [Bordetella trematum]|uniref:hypothetical protein n=1 Tax=Bordetella trematum TaxID=123899 RepID=UPI003AF3C6B7